LVTSSRSDASLTIIARPDKSATWRANKLVLLALAIPSLGAAIGFTLLGAWPILPFAGLELLSLAAALYYVDRKLRRCEVITVGETVVTIAKGSRAPQQVWRLRRDSTRLSIVAERHPWEGPLLRVHDRSESVTLGEFLAREDQLELVALLRRELRVRAESAAAEVTF
tara:strand:- start:46 stop:549 length:504 start_codon:yes stop_codon:yes gene_type:complete